MLRLLALASLLLASLLLASLLLACDGEEPSAPDPTRAAVLAALRFPGEPAPLAPRWSEPVPMSASDRRWSVRVGSYEVRAGFRAAALLLLPDRPWEGGVLVAHGHYGQGKNSAEAQDIAHALAASGVAALVVDTPGVEEWDIPGRRIHLDEGAHGRALLAAGGTSALALQVEVLRRGVDLLDQLGAEKIAATGASGGAVQSFWLALADPRVIGVALASFPPIPREARPGGCACDQLPGFPGPDPRVLGLLEQQSLWMSEVEQPAPEGLPSSSRFEVLAGPHSYNLEMISRALAWMEDTLGLPLDPVTLDPAPHLELHTAGPAEGAFARLAELPLAPARIWSPAARPGPPSQEACAGAGRAVLVVGAGEEAAAAVRAQGLQSCTLRLLDDDEAGRSEALSRGEAYADRLIGTLQVAAARRGAVGVYAARGWALPAAGLGLPFVVEDPILKVEQVDERLDPEWIHAPGLWWGGLEPLLARATASGLDRVALASALAATLNP